MKKKINYKNNYIGKQLIIFIVFFLFSFFVVSALILSNRNYFFIESSIKEFSSKINSIVIDKFYSNNNLEEYVINARILYLQEEISQLKKMNSLKEENVNYEIAKIINHTSKNWFNTTEISKGYSSGIKKNAPVINSEGLIGFVSKTSKSISEVKLITSVNEDNMLSVFINTNEAVVSGLLSEYDKKNELFKIKSVSSKSNIKKGDIVTLSGYNNELYNGIFLGTVEKVEDNNYGLDKNVYVKSNVNFDDMLYVLIIKE